MQIWLPYCPMCVYLVCTEALIIYHIIKRCSLNEKIPKVSRNNVAYIESVVRKEKHTLACDFACLYWYYKSYQEQGRI